MIVIRKEMFILSVLCCILLCQCFSLQDKSTMLFDHPVENPEAIGFQFAYELYTHNSNVYDLVAPELHQAVDIWFESTIAIGCSGTVPKGSKLTLTDGHLMDEMEYFTEDFGLRCGRQEGGEANFPCPRLLFEKIKLERRPNVQELDDERSPYWQVTGWSEPYLCGGFPHVSEDSHGKAILDVEAHNSILTVGEQE